MGLLPRNGFLGGDNQRAMGMIVNYVDSSGITIFALRQVGHCCNVPFIAPPPGTGAGLELHNIGGPPMLPRACSREGKKP